MLFTCSTSKKHPKDTDIRIHQSIRIDNNPNRISFKVFDGVRDLRYIMKSTRSGCSSCGEK